MQHYIRNWLYVQRNWGPERAEQHIPAFAKKWVLGHSSLYETNLALLAFLPRIHTLFWGKHCMQLLLSVGLINESVALDPYLLV
jgi:hypothetical protein